MTNPHPIAERLHSEVAYGRSKNASMDASRWANIAEEAATLMTELFDAADAVPDIGGSNER